MAKQPEKLTKEFRGRTEGDVEGKFADWQKETWGRVRAINKLPLTELPLPLQDKKSGYQPSGPAPDVFSMVIEYEAVPIADEPDEPR
jgi:hypothetical protein